MAVKIVTVQTFPSPIADKPQATKPLEEASEIYNEWKQLCGTQDGIATCNECTYKCASFEKTVDEIADTIQACVNLAKALGVDDMRDAMKECEKRNRARGRM